MRAQTVYRALLHCYPAAFRDEYGGQMMFREQLGDARRGAVVRPPARLAGQSHGPRRQAQSAGARRHRHARPVALGPIAGERAARAVAPLLVGAGLLARTVTNLQSAHFFAGRDPIGKHIVEVNDETEAGRTGFQIVGVARDARTKSLRAAVVPRYYKSSAQRPAGLNTPTYLIRTAADPALALGAVRHTIERVQAGLPILPPSRSMRA